MTAPTGDAAAPADAPAAPDPDELVQMNARVPRWLRDAIDARRALLPDPFREGKTMSRDRWIINASKHALDKPRGPVKSAPRHRTAPTRSL